MKTMVAQHISLVLFGCLIINSWQEREEIISSQIVENYNPLNLTPMAFKKKGVRMKLGDEQKEYLVWLHNLYRMNASPPAANMHLMFWDEKLAEEAQAWTDYCLATHGQDPYLKHYTTFGQNLYMGPSKLLTRSVWLWYDERNYYDIKYGNCSKEPCGHYVTLMWAKTFLVGCGMSKCGKNYFVFVCNYLPQGNIAEVAPYRIGRPCSMCEESGFLCLNNSCVLKESCKEKDLPCDCNIKCHNCGILNKETCSCTCKDGWDFNDCSRPCANSHIGCWQPHHYYDKITCGKDNYTVGQYHCRNMCGHCVNITSAAENNKCCDGKTCLNGYVLDRRCSCKLLCPGPECYEYEEDSAFNLKPKLLPIILLVLVHCVWNIFRN